MLSTAPGARRIGLALPLLTLVACAAGPVTPTPNFGVDVSLPSPAPLASPLAVLVDDAAAAPASTYTISLVDTGGRVVAAATARRRSQDLSGCTVSRLPLVSASARRVFFLDGDSTLMWLDPDGKTGSIRSLGNEKGTEVSFSVSPDEERMAVVTVVAISGGFHEAVTVETLGGAGSGTPIFTRDASGSGSAGEVSWPVGWHGDTLVLADGSPLPAGGCDGRPRVTGYDVVDPVSGEARLHMCFGTADGLPVGPPSAAGVLCAGHLDGRLTLSVDSWTGSSASFATASCLPGGSLSPDGGRAALNAAPCAATGPVVLVSRGGAEVRTQAAGLPAAWLDAHHVVVTAGGARAAVVDAGSGATAGVAAAGVVESILPPSL
ncbi:MAG: hypothetical protein ACYDAC_12120 [Candidatus Dormibacteria bacterium]